MADHRLQHCLENARAYFSGAGKEEASETAIGRGGDGARGEASARLGGHELRVGLGQEVVTVALSATPRSNTDKYGVPTTSSACRTSGRMGARELARTTTSAA